MSIFNKKLKYLKQYLWDLKSLGNQRWQIPLIVALKINDWLTLGMLPWNLRNNIPRFPFLSFLLSERVKKLFKSYLTRDRPESPKRSMIFFEEFFGEAGFSPRGSELRKLFFGSTEHPLPFLLDFAKQTPKEFTFAVIPSHTFVFFFSLVWRCIYFWSACSKITAHSAAVKFGFRFLLFWAIVFILAREARTLAHADNHYRNSTTSSLSTG